VKVEQRSALRSALTLRSCCLTAAIDKIKREIADNLLPPEA
jgi:hypothetical protein